MRTMYDAVTAANIPRSAAIVAGYVDRIKLAPWTSADWDRFPGAVKVQIVKKASSYFGHVLDVEKGDAEPVEAPGWVQARRAAGADPTVYCNASTWPAVRAAFRSAGVAEPHYWIAKYDGDPTIPAGAIAKQYRGDVAPGIDISSVADYWPGVDNPQENDMQQSDMFQPWDPNIISGTGGKTSVNQWMSGVLGRLDALATSVAALTAGQSALTKAVAVISNNPDITVDQMRELVDAAVSQHVQITGDVHIGPTP